MGRKIENRNIDVTKARGELEEDLLEYVYRTWRQGRQITSKEYAREVNITGYEAAGLVRSLVKKGFLCEPENGHLELTDKGKLEGMECLARHEKLTQFFQMVSGMDQQRAQEDACRVEHYISPEGLKGIENFLQYGDVYDRVYDDMDLYTFYEDGEFPMAFGLYEPERRNPRFLAPEYGKLEHSVILRVKKSQNCFLLKTKKDESIGYVWYRRDDEWIQAKEESNTAISEITIRIALTLIPRLRAVLSSSANRLHIFVIISARTSPTITYGTKVFTSSQVFIVILPLTMAATPDMFPPFIEFNALDNPVNIASTATPTRIILKGLNPPFHDRL